MKRILIVAPLLIIPFLIYALIAATSGEAGADAALQNSLFGMPMLSGSKWNFRLGDFVLVIGLVALFIEILKAARTKNDALANHSLSMVLLLVMVIAFLIFPGFATSVFFLLVIMCVLDVIAGPIVSIVAARRDFGIGADIG